MTVQNAIKILKVNAVLSLRQTEFCGAVKIAVSAMEKQIPKKPCTYENTIRADCPVCGNTVRWMYNAFTFGSYCSGCGQAIDWSGDEAALKANTAFMDAVRKK